MKINGKYYFLELLNALLLLAMIFGCNKNAHDSQKLMTLDAVAYVVDFPKTFVLQNKEDTGIDIPGVWDFVIQDSMMILSTRNSHGVWKFLSLPEHRERGNFLTVGGGPLELSSQPSVSDKVKFVKEDNHLQAYLYDFGYGKLFRMDIGTTILDQDLSMKIINDALPKYLFDFLVIDSTSYFCKEIANMETQQMWYLYSKGEKSMISPMEKLNAAAVTDNMDYNILSTMTRWSDKHKKVVEMHFGLNYINLYSLDNSFAQTICLGKKLDNISDIESLALEDRMFQFSDVRVYDDFFGVVYIHEQESDYKNTRKNLPSILLFDWNGNPLAELNSNSFITSFDIDFTRGELYTFDVKSDEFAKYDIADILLEIRSHQFEQGH